MLFPLLTIRYLLIFIYVSMDRLLILSLRAVLYLAIYFLIISLWVNKNTAPSEAISRLGDLIAVMAGSSVGWTPSLLPQSENVACSKLDLLVFILKWLSPPLRPEAARNRMRVLLCTVTALQKEYQCILWDYHAILLWSFFPWIKMSPWSKEQTQGPTPGQMLKIIWIW